VQNFTGDLPRLGSLHLAGVGGRKPVFQVHLVLKRSRSGGRGARSSLGDQKARPA